MSNYSEEIVIGCLLLDEVFCKDKIDFIDQFLFKNREYRKLFNKIRETFKSGLPVDFITLRVYAGLDSEDVELLSEIVQFTPITANGDFYLREMQLGDCHGRN